MISNNQDISTHRYFGEDDENSSSSQSPPSGANQQENNYFFSYGRSSSMVSQQQQTTKHHSNGHSNHHSYKVLVSGGGFAGLVLSYYLLHSLSHKHNNLPIEITIVEKASMYRQVGAIITLEGEQVLRALKEMNLDDELQQIEIPRSKQHFYTKSGRHVRSFDETSVAKYKEEGRRYERHKFHEILMKRIKPLIVRREGNVTVLSNNNHSATTVEDEVDDSHFKMNRVVYSMRPSLFNKEKIEVTLMNKNEWLHLQYQKEQQENIQMKRSSSVCSNTSPRGNSQRIMNDISSLEKKDTPTNRLSKLHKRKSTGSSGDLQQMEEESVRKNSTAAAEIATPNSAGKESAGWRRFFQKKESNAQSPSTQKNQTSNSSSNILLEGTPMSSPLSNAISNDPKRTSMNDLLVTFNDGETFESSVYQSTEDRKLYQIEREEFDLVIGADGIHSQTRALLFGDESHFKHFLGVGYFCFLVDMILNETDEQQVSEKYWNNVYGMEKKSTESFDPTQISGIKGLEPLTPDRIAKMKEVSKKIGETIKDGESSSVLLNQGRYLNVLRYGNKLSVTCVYREPKEEEMHESSSYSVGKSKSFVDDSLVDTPGDTKSSPSTQEKWRKRFSLFRKHTESPVKNEVAQDPSATASSLTNHFYSFDINKFEDHHESDDQKSMSHSSDSSEDHEERMEEEDEEIAEAFMEMVNESMANKESTSVQHLEDRCATPTSSNSSPTSSDEKSSSGEKKHKKKKLEKSHHSKTFFIPAENRKNFLKHKFEDCGFLFNDIMELVYDSRIIYYDDLAQIRNLDHWYKGKCVLVGDACQACTPLSGKGGALAIIAAKTLAVELRSVLETHASSEGDDNLHTIPLEKSIYFDSCLQQAFEKYESAMQERIKTVQKKTVWEGVDVYLAKSGVKRMVRDSALKFLPKSVLLKLTKKEEEQGVTKK